MLATWGMTPVFWAFFGPGWGKPYIFCSKMEANSQLLHSMRPIAEHRQGFHVRAFCKAPALSESDAAARKRREVCLPICKNVTQEFLPTAPLPENNCSVHRLTTAMLTAVRIFWDGSGKSRRLQHRGKWQGSFWDTGSIFSRSRTARSSAQRNHLRLLQHLTELPFTGLFLERQFGRVSAFWVRVPTPYFESGAC